MTDAIHVRRHLQVFVFTDARPGEHTRDLTSESESESNGVRGRIQ